MTLLQSGWALFQPLSDSWMFRCVCVHREKLMHSQRLLCLQRNPYVAFHGFSRQRDQVAADLAAVPRLSTRLAAEWYYADTFNSLTATYEPTSMGYMMIIGRGSDLPAWASYVDAEIPFLGARPGPTDAGLMCARQRSLQAWRGWACGEPPAQCWDLKCTVNHGWCCRSAAGH